MKTKWDLKSMLVGAALGVCALLGLGAVATGGAATRGNVGRFQISAAQVGAWVVDTVTGEVWSSINPDSFRVPKLKINAGDTPAQPGILPNP